MSFLFYIFIPMFILNKDTMYFIAFFLLNIVV